MSTLCWRMRTHSNICCEMKWRDWTALCYFLFFWCRTTLHFNQTSPTTARHKQSTQLEADCCLTCLSLSREKNKLGENLITYICVLHLSKTGDSFLDNHVNSSALWIYSYMTHCATAQMDWVRLLFRLTVIKNKTLTTYLSSVGGDNYLHPAKCVLCVLRILRKMSWELL